MLINRVQAGELPSVTIMLQYISPQNQASMALSAPNKVFTQEPAVFSLDPDPGTLPDSLIQMALNKVFIPLSMITTAPLN